jgi:cytochrome c556
MNDKQILLLPIIIMALFLTSCAPQQVNPDTSVKKNMQQVTMPASNIVFAVANVEPRNAQDWQQVKRNALNLVASGEWLLSSPANKDQHVWQQSAKTLLAAATAVAKAADANDVEAVNNAGNDLYTSCESCHAHYPTKPNSKSY